MRDNMKRMMKALFLTCIMATSVLSGCFGSEEEEVDVIDKGVFDFEIGNRTWYHFPGGIDALENSSNLSGNNIPFYSTSSYYGIGMSTFEPTMGITSTGNLYITSWGNGNSGSTAIVQCSNMVEMTSISDYSCVDVYGAQPPVPNSNDPYVYVDPWTDRIMKFDMHALGGMTVEWSDDEGASWSLPYIATGYSVQDHQTIASSNMPALFHHTTWMFCINGNAPHPLCSSSQDGGATWGPETSGAPVSCNSGGLSAHLVGSIDGNFYRGNKGCTGDGYSVFRTTNAGISWTEHVLPTTETGIADTWNAEEAQVEVDSVGNVHAMWMGLDNMPYWSYSIDQGDTWSNATMIAPPINLSGTGFPVVVAGDAGTVAFGYVGETEGEDEIWNAYLTYATDAFSENPLFTTVQLNTNDDPIDIVVDCGYNRCGGLGDFLDIRVDAYGRTWFSLSHNIADMGIFATISSGPSLRGENITMLPEMPLGGMQTL